MSLTSPLPQVLVFSMRPAAVDVRVADFGLSREIDMGLSNTLTAFIGSPSYMAPEVLKNHARLDSPPHPAGICPLLFFCSSPRSFPCALRVFPRVVSVCVLGRSVG